MTEATQPRMARGTRLPLAALAAALFALLAFAPFASATPDPVASGTTTVTLNKGWTKYLKTFGIKIQKVGNTKVKGQKVTFKVSGGEMDPTNGLGTLTLAGGLKFKAGKKSATVKALVLNTGKSSLTGKVSGKKVKLAKLKGLSYSRNGFGVNVKLKSLKLEKAGAKQLNKKLGLRQGQAEAVPRRQEHRQVGFRKPAGNGGDRPRRQRELRRRSGPAAEAERRRNHGLGDRSDHRKRLRQL